MSDNPGNKWRTIKSFIKLGRAKDPSPTSRAVGIGFVADEMKATNDKTIHDGGDAIHKESSRLHLKLRQQDYEPTEKDLADIETLEQETESFISKVFNWNRQ